MPQKNQKKKKTIVVKVVKKTTKKVKAKKRTTRNAKPRFTRPMRMNMADQYMKCLADPFKYGPVRAGFGTLLPTQLHTAYYRNTGFAGSDGTLRLFCNPALLNGININNTAVGSTPAWQSYNYSNYAAITSQADELRVLSMGVRCFPRIAATSPPGMCFMNVVPKCDASEIQLYCNSTAAAAAALPYSQIHLASSQSVDFYQNCWRPGSSEDFEFRNYDSAILNNNTGVLSLNTITSSTGGWVESPTAHLDTIFTGLPYIASAGTPVFFEVICHYETTNSILTISNETEDDASPSVASEGQFASAETMFRKMANMLPDTSTVAAIGGTILASPLISKNIHRYNKNPIGYVQVD